MSVGHPKDRFSHDADHLVHSIYSALGELTTVCIVGQAKLGHSACMKSMPRTNTIYWLTGDRCQTKQFCFLDADCLVYLSIYTS